MDGTRARPRLGRAVALVVASAVALIGLVVLIVAWTSVGTAAVRAGTQVDVPCLAAYDANTDGADVRFTMLPAQAICSWDVDGVREDVVFASAPTAVVNAAAIAALGGIGVTVGILVVAWRERRAEDERRARERRGDDLT